MTKPKTQKDLDAEERAQDLALLFLVEQSIDNDEEAKALLKEYFDAGALDMAEIERLQQKYRVPLEIYRKQRMEGKI